MLVTTPVSKDYATNDKVNHQSPPMTKSTTYQGPLLLLLLTPMIEDQQASVLVNDDSNDDHQSKSHPSEDYKKGEKFLY